MRVFRIIALLSICFYLSAADESRPNLGRETKVDSVLASVNGESVTLLDVMLETGREEARLAAMFTGEQLYSNIKDLRKDFLNRIVDRKLVYEQFKQTPFDIPRQQVEDMVDNLASSMGDGTREALERRAKSYGSSLDELRDKAREMFAVEMLFYRNCDRRVQITPKEVFETYRDNPERWSKSARVEIQLLQVRRESGVPGLDPAKVAENLRNMLKDADGEMFTRIVRENSNGPNASTGGKMGWIDADKLRPEFSAALKDSKKGDIVGPVETPEAYYFIRVCDMAAPETVAFEKVAPEIEKELFEKARRDRRKVYTDQLRKEAVIRFYFE